ncbi:MAG TPA: RES domain-containing protein [Terriglobales bacterium]|nr:RES domain-containing protein [Terriglobales bacterium]
MIITAWRITKRRHAKAAFTGAGAKKYGGRWNSPGSALVYTSATQSLALLEILVHLQTPELIHEYVSISVGIDEQLIQRLDPSRLPRDWRAEPVPAQVRNIGDEWVKSMSSVVLEVPSVLVPAESNFLLNPAHPDFPRLLIGEPVRFAFDERFAR